jgi:Zn finger protein HypA/HybF involved in hydrogenase expression
MPIAPKALKFKCSQCGYTKIIKPNSDVLTHLDFISECPKCKGKMKQVELNLIEKLLF